MGECCVECLVSQYIYDAARTPDFELWSVLCRWIYRLVVSMDCNFRLKSRFRAGGDHDPTLGPGLGYFVEHTAYHKFIMNYVDQEEVCSFLLHIVFLY